MKPLGKEWQELLDAIGGGEGADSPSVATAKAKLQIQLTLIMHDVIGGLSGAIRTWTTSSDKLGRRIYWLTLVLVVLTLILVLFGADELGLIKLRR